METNFPNFFPINTAGITQHDLPVVTIFLAGWGFGVALMWLTFKVHKLTVRCIANDVDKQVAEWRRIENLCRKEDFVEKSVSVVGVSNDQKF